MEKSAKKGLSIRIIDAQPLVENLGIQRFRSQRQGDGIDAIPLVSGRWVAFAFKDVTQMRVTRCTANFDALHAHRDIFEVSHGFASKRGKEGRPATVRVKLLATREKFSAARAARVDAFFVAIPILAGVSALGSGFSQDMELLRAQLSAPFLVSLRNFWAHNGSNVLAAHMIPQPAPDSQPKQAE